ncbi:MAG: hypothetical protein KAI83_01340 [Thiomargarita sp.]|nr:hypothetical protein [Thiomargarita sp.]
MLIYYTELGRVGKCVHQHCINHPYRVATKTRCPSTCFLLKEQYWRMSMKVILEIENDFEAKVFF